MRTHGAAVAAKDDPGLTERLAGLGLSGSASTCHVAEVGGYVVAGHVPAEAISKLLLDHPEGMGLVVPGMPQLSPGMGGDRQDWLDLDVFLLGHDGELRPFDF